MDTVWSPSGPQRSREAPLPVVWADVGAAAGDGEDQALIAEDLDRPQYGVAANVMLLLELFHRRQRTVAPLASQVMLLMRTFMNATARQRTATQTAALAACAKVGAGRPLGTHWT